MRSPYSINEIKLRVKPVADAYGVGCIALFGSYARNEASVASDIDLHIIDKGKIIGLFRFAGFCREVGEQFEVPVDVMTSGSLEPEFLARIIKEEVIIYGDYTRQ